MGEQYRTAASAIPNPFEDESRHVKSYTAEQIATLQSRLDRQLGPEYISTRPGAGGAKVHYLAAEKVINLANEVFGFNGWSSQIQTVQIDFVDEINGKITLGLSIITRVTLRDGTFHEDIGYGHIENCKGKAAAFEKAKKEAATDALKRALRNFGNVLGNCLYDKEYLSRVTKMKVQPSRWDADNLHRHPDFAPPRETKSATAIRDTDKAAEDESHALDRDPHRTLSTGMEIEDEFGDNVFDGVEVQDASPDEVALNEARARANTTTPRRSFTAQPPQRQLPPRRQVEPPTRPAQQPLTSPRPPTHQQHPHATSSHHPHTTPAGAKPAPPLALASDTHPAAPAHDPPVGFITSRAADLLASGPPSAAISRSLPEFNPKAESPSLRRTSGIDHTSSRPVSRSLTHVAPSDAASASDSRAAAVAAGTGPGRRAAGNIAVGPSNVVNPSADANRRIGMPPPAMGGAAGSPLANRGSYKPPGPAAGAKRAIGNVEGGSGGGGGGAAAGARSPLKDVSNVGGANAGAGGAAAAAAAAAADGEGAKKAKIEDNSRGGIRT